MLRKVIYWVFATVVVVGLVPGSILAATGETGNGCPSGAHYNLNIIGMDKAENVDPDSITIAADAIVGWRPVTVTLADGTSMTIRFEVL